MDSTGLETFSSEELTLDLSEDWRTEEPHLYIMARRGEHHPLLGPFPLPDTYRGLRRNHASEALSRTMSGHDELADNRKLLIFDQRPMGTSTALIPHLHVY